MKTLKKLRTFFYNFGESKKQTKTKFKLFYYYLNFYPLDSQEKVGGVDTWATVKRLSRTAFVDNIFYLVLVFL